MKQNLLYAAALTIMMALGTNGHAKSWRVNSNTTRGAHFADINAAMSSANVQDGDTLYLDPGCNISSNQDVTKRVTIIGNGFFHDKGQPYGFTTISGGIWLSAVGCKIEGVILTNTTYVSADKVTIERCKVNSIESSGLNCKNATIRNCYINTSNNYQSIYGAGSTSQNTAYWTIENNIIMIGYYRDYWRTAVQNLLSPTIRNNYIQCGANEPSYYSCISEVSNGTITDNIIVNNRSQNNIFRACSDCVILHNVLSCVEGTYAGYPTNKCINTVELSTIFTMSGANDLQYQLCEDSPAKGYASDGGDCGPYGSGYTYVAGGLPLGKPYYTEATIGSMAHDGKVNVSFKIAVQDE